MSSEELQTVAVMTGPAPTVLGGTVNAVVTITGEPDRKVRGAKAQLVRTAIHRVTQTNVLDHGSHDSLLHEAVVITEVMPLIEAGLDPANVRCGQWIHTIPLAHHPGA